MAKTYKKNAQNVYKVPLYAQFWTWWALVLALSILSLVLGLVLSIKLVLFLRDIFADCLRFDH